MRKLFDLFLAGLVGILLEGLLVSCGDASPTTVPAVPPTPNTTAALTAAATPSVTPTPLPEPWYPLPPDAYNNPNFSGPNGTLLKQLAENSTRYSSARVSFTAKSNGQSNSVVNFTIVIPKKGVVWFDFAYVYRPLPDGEYVSNHFIAVDDNCYTWQDDKSWQKETPFETSRCKDIPWLIIELHSVLTTFLGAPDMPKVAPENMPVLDIKMQPDEIYQGKQVGVLTIDGIITWRYEKATYRLVQMRHDQGGGAEVEIRFDNYDDPNLKIIAPI